MAGIKYAKDPYNRNTSCIPCQEGEHRNCRHAMDGPRFSRNHPKGTCKCENDGHPPAIGCRVRIMDGWDSHQCDRPIKGTISVREQFSGGMWHERGDYDQPACGIHIGARKRRDANDEARRVRNDERKERDRRSKENRQSAQDYCDKLAELDVKAEPVPGYDYYYDGKVAIQAETLWGLVSELSDLRKMLDA